MKKEQFSFLNNFSLNDKDKCNIKSMFFLVIIFSVTLSAKAQLIDNVLAKTFYTYKHNRDTTKKDSIHIENMVLFMGKSASSYMSFDKTAKAIDLEKQTNEQAISHTGAGAPTFSYKNVKNTTPTEIYYFPLVQKTMIREFLIRNYLYEDKKENINWVLSNELRTIDKLSCQKATANFKGRLWTAWFATAIPFEYGPWKLHGLPGLILEAYDQNREIQFLFSGFTSISDAVTTNISSAKKTDYTIQLPQKALKVSRAEFLKISDAMYKNPKGFFMAQLNATKGFAEDETDMVGFSFKKINNPIDLTENN